MDCLTKFDLKTHSARYWNSLQQQLLTPDWLQSHPHSWYQSAVNDSHTGITTQIAGKPANPDISLTAHHINVSPQLCNDISPPERDWSLLANLIKQQSLRPPKAIFRIMRWVTFSALW